MRWSRLSEQIFRVDKWTLCRGYATAPWAVRLALGVGPADRLERLMSLVIRHTGHGRQGQRPGGGGKQEMLGHVIASSDVHHWIYG